MRGVAAAVPVALLLAACSPSDGGERPWSSGSRLRARVWTADNGTRQFAGRWFDAERDEECRFVGTDSGLMHCLPPAQIQYMRFADAECSVPAGAVAGGAQPEWFIVYEPCGENASLRPIGAPIEPPPAALFKLDGTSCVADDPLQFEAQVFTLGPPDNLSGFVPAQTRREQTGPVLREWIEAEDGARQLSGETFDPATGGRIWAFLPDLVDRLFPPLDVVGGAFADDACAEPLACVSPFACPGEHPDLAVVFEPECSGPPFTIRRLEPAVAVSTNDEDGVCVPVSPTSPPVCSAPGEAVPLETFPAVTVMLDAGGRLRPRFRGVQGGGAIGFGFPSFEDTELGVACSPREIGGTHRCLPTVQLPEVAAVDPFFSNVLFDDPACQHIAALNADDASPDSCGPPELPRYLFDFFRFDQSRTNLFRVGPRLEADALAGLFFQTPFTNCTPLDPSGLTFAFHSLTEVPIEDLASVERTTE